MPVNSGHPGEEWHESKIKTNHDGHSTRRTAGIWLSRLVIHIPVCLAIPWESLSLQFSVIIHLSEGKDNIDSSVINPENVCNFKKNRNSLGTQHYWVLAKYIYNCASVFDHFLDFPGPVVKTLNFKCRAQGFDP